MHLIKSIESSEVKRFFVVFIILLPGTWIISSILKGFVWVWIPPVKTPQQLMVSIILPNLVKFFPLIFSGILAYFITKLKTAFIFTIIALIIGALYFFVFFGPVT